MRSTDVTRWLCGALAASLWTASAGLAAAVGAGPDAPPKCSSKCGPNRYLTVATTNGPVKGHIAPGTECVLEYLGVPYAKPPVGDLRFAPPQPIDTKSPYDADEFGFDCPLSPSRPVTEFPDLTPQALDVMKYFATGAGTPQSEDCLTLNIWSKTTAKASHKKKPVLVFFYGGRFTIGNTNSPFYNGKHFANAQDIVVVTVNYRVNIFGFPSAPGEVQNLGLRDQRAAVEWIRTNIGKFGGDASRIIIAGQSSGGVAADYWAYAYEQDPIAAGLILVSGNAFSFPVNALGVTDRNWETVVGLVGCNTTTDHAEIMSCMRSVDWQDIKAAAATVRPAPSTSVLRSVPPFYPQVDNEIVFDDYLSLTAQGRFARIPVLGGHNHYEAGYYRVPAYGQGRIPTPDQVDSFHLESFTCPASYQANARRAHGVSTWVYRYYGDWDNTRLYPDSGAYHGVDLHMIFGGSEEVSGIAPSEEQKKVTKEMQKAWFVFAKDPEDGLEKELGWPKWNPDEDTLIGLAYNNQAGVQTLDPATYDAPCSTITMGALGVPTPTN
ncbi:hypothetical protein VTJ49DRAFT_3474 [Mycothermus thermophilus]|uniref:Carboxylic ester hydrolase n=1 Tax=Humicola insolens TaxID=85995 RepID=A0ABR3VMB8_HUMIN